MKTLITAIAACAFAGSLAFAEDAAPAKGDKPKRDPAKAFAKIDADNDGKVTLEEFKASPMGKKDPAKAEAAFGKKDKDGNGSLSLEEFSAQGGKKKKDS